MKKKNTLEPPPYPPRIFWAIPTRKSEKEGRGTGKINIGKKRVPDFITALEKERYIRLTINKL